MSEFKNRIRETREALGLSQRDLATAVKTSQQQIQRIEAGVQAVRLDLAAAIAAVLNSPLEELFPGLPRPKISGRRKKSRRQEPRPSKEALEEVGIDSDPRHWSVKIGFRGGKAFFFDVSSKEKKRISSIIWSPPTGFDFIVFDTRTHRVAINREMINYCNFLFDVGIEEPETEDDDFGLVVHFIGTESPERFGVEPDDQECAEDESGWRSQLQQLFIQVDGKAADDEEILYFDDEDGERVYLRSKQIFCMELPLFCCEPSLWRTYLDEDDESEPEEASHQADAGEQPGGNK